MEDNGTTDKGTTDNTNNGTETTPKSLDVGESTNKSLEDGGDSGKTLDEGEDPHKTLPTRDHETKKINESDHESKANDEAYEEPKEEVKADLFNLDYFDKPEEAPQEVTEKASDLINGDLNYFDNWITEAEDQKKQNKEQLDAYLKSNVESGNQLAYNTEDFIEGSDKIYGIDFYSGPFKFLSKLKRNPYNDKFKSIKAASRYDLHNIANDIEGAGAVDDRRLERLNNRIEEIDRALSETPPGFREPFEKLKREIEFAKEKAQDINTYGVTKNTGISAESEKQQIDDALTPVKERLMSAYESGSPTEIENAKQAYERVANRVKQDFEGSEVSRRDWNVLNKPEVFYQKMEEEYGPTPETPTRTSEPVRTEPIPETSTEVTSTETSTTESETPETSTETSTPTDEPEVTPEPETESEEESTTDVETETPTTSSDDTDVIAKADEAKAAYEEAKKREYEAIHREADETEIAQLAAEVERLRQEWEEAEAEAAALRPREDGEDESEKPRVGHGREDRELSKEETLPEWVGGDDPHNSSAGAYWAGAFGDENWSDKVPPKTVQGLIDYANDHHDNPFAMFGMTALMEAGGYDALKAGKDVQDMIAAAKEVTVNANNAIDFFKNGSVLDGIKSIFSTGWSVLKVLGNAVSAAWNVCKSTFSFLRSIFAPLSSAVSSFLSTVNGYNSVKSMIRDMFGVENTDEVIKEIFGDNSETNTEQTPVNVLNKTGFSVKSGTVTDESGYNKGMKEKENEIASDVCKKTMLYFPYLRKAIR